MSAAQAHGTPNARASGTFLLGGDLRVHRLGFGAMRITGRGIWGDPPDRHAALHMLRRLPELGVALIDTADAYGPHVSEDLLREALHPYPGTVIATKGGLVRHGPDRWAAVGRPEYLRQCLLMSLRRLQVERIDLWQLHRVDAKVPQGEQFDAIRAMRDEGLIRHVGLSQVDVPTIQEAQRYFPVVSVQNRYSLVDRKDEAVLDHCEREGIAFLPWYPLAAGALARPGTVLGEVATRLKATHAQVALAWLLRRSPVMLPIPGTGSLAHLEENVAAARLTLHDAGFTALDRASREAWDGEPPRE